MIGRGSSGWRKGGRVGRLTVKRPSEMVPTNLARVTVPLRAGILVVETVFLLSTETKGDTANKYRKDVWNPGHLRAFTSVRLGGKEGPPMATATPSKLATMPSVQYRSAMNLFLLPTARQMQSYMKQ